MALINSLQLVGLRMDILLQLKMKVIRLWLLTELHIGYSLVATKLCFTLAWNT